MEYPVDTQVIELPSERMIDLDEDLVAEDADTITEIASGD